jgi:hypothetical protein
MLTALALLVSLTATPDSLTFSGREGNLEVYIPRLAQVDLRIDGRLDEAVWAEAAVLADFTQYEPVEGVVPEEATELRVFYTEDAIYFGIRASDPNPELVLARLGERDRAVFGDDWVRIMLDTFDDQRQAYVFYVNPLGLQTDGLWIEGYRGRGGGGGFGGGGVSIDFNPDFIWESDGHVDENGWSAELRIPYVSLRFREIPEQNWGIQVAREVKRKGFKQSWAPITKEVSSTLAQSGKLMGLRDLRPRRLMELNPVVTGARTGSDATGTFLRDDPEGDFGLNGRVGLTQNLVLDATYNPDFSQVEADANQISVNERFALFFPEKRAFFLEGAEIFNTPARLVYTRQIVDPVGGAKLTGKVGAFQVGYVGAVDESPTTLLGGEGNAAFNLVRARRDIGTGSTVGLLFTDRSLTDGSGAFSRVFGGDARLVFGGRYTLTTQLAGSLTRDAGEDAHDGLQPLIKMDVARSGRSFSWNLGLTDIAPDFRARSGFITRSGHAEVTGGTSFTHFRAPGSFIQTASVRITSQNFFRHEDLWDGVRPFEHEVEVWPTLSLRGGRTLTFVLRRGYFRFLQEDYESYQVLGPDGPQPFQVPDPLNGMNAWGVIPRMRITNALNINGMAFFREVPIFAEASRGHEVQVSPEIQYRPTAQLQLSLNYRYSRIHRQRAETLAERIEEEYSTVNLPRLRVQYQFNKSLFIRGIAQWELQDRAALVDPTTGDPLLLYGSEISASSTGEFQGQFLVQYQPSPGTIFYIGYSRLMEGRRTYSLEQMNPVDEGLFVKLSYLFRM